MSPFRSPTSRRDLFRGLGSRKPSALRDPAIHPDSFDSGPGDLLVARRDAMGSYFEVRVPARVPAAIDLMTRALDRIEALEAQMTVYRDDSELSRLNATAHDGPVAVEEGLFRLIQRGVELCQATGGAYDLTAGALTQAWGFFKGPKRVPDTATLADARARTGSHHLILDTENRTIAFDRPGIVINLGSIGKGHALDEATAIVQSHWWPTPALVHGGRSSVFALGSPPDRFGGRWQIQLHNPFDPLVPLGVIHLRNRALGTSGATYQQFESGGRVYSHIIDPRTGEPPGNGPASVTALAPTAAEADALATAFSLLGPERTAAYIDDHPEVGAIFVLESPSDGSPVLQTLGLTDADFTTDFPIVAMSQSGSRSP